jgi:hypothetical protein
VVRRDGRIKTNVFIYFWGPNPSFLSRSVKQNNISWPWSAFGYQFRALQFRLPRKKAAHMSYVSDDWISDEAIVRLAIISSLMYPKSLF